MDSSVNIPAAVNFLFVKFPISINILPWPKLPIIEIIGLFVGRIRIDDPLP
jgi:hypothetical protein